MGCAVRDRGLSESYFPSREEAELWAMRVFGRSLPNITFHAVTPWWQEDPNELLEQAQREDWEALGCPV